MDYSDVERKVSQGGTELIELRSALRQLQERLDRQSLVIKVLTEMLLSQGGVSEDQFRERLQQAADRKATESACRNCGKPLNAKHTRCMYCGEPRPPELL